MTRRRRNSEDAGRRDVNVGLLQVKSLFYRKRQKLGAGFHVINKYNQFSLFYGLLSRHELWTKES